MKKAVVTGGAGFIGSHIVDALLESGVKVLVIDDFSTGQDSNLEDAKCKFSGQLEVSKFDICSTDAAKALRDFEPDVVFHNAAQINVRNSVVDPAFDAEKNVVGTINILEAARLSGVKCFIESSTGGAIYGVQKEYPASEEHKTAPESPYGLSKLCSEHYLDYYARFYGMHTIALRYSNVYGPRQNPKGEAGVVAIFSERLFAGEQLRVNGDGKQTRDFVFVADVVSANILAASNIKEKGFFIYNIGRGLEISVLDIVSELEKLWPELKPEGAAEIQVTHGPEMSGEQRRSCISPAKFSNEFSWSPDVDLSQGLRLTLKSY